MQPSSLHAGPWLSPRPEANAIRANHIVEVDFNDGMIRPASALGPSIQGRHRLFVATLPGEGANEARNRYERLLRFARP